MSDESAVGDLFSPSVEDTGVLADLEGDAAAEADIELVLDLGGDSARNGLSCLAVVALRDLGERGDDPERAPPALEGDGPGDPGELFRLPRDLVIPEGRGLPLLSTIGVPLCPSKASSLSRIFSPFSFFAVFVRCLLCCCWLAARRTGSLC